MVVKLMCGCGTQLQVKEKDAGKKARCRSCGNVFVVPNRKPPVMGVQEATSAKQKCKKCLAPMEKGGVVCIACGFHEHLGRQLVSTADSESTIKTMLYGGMVVVGLGALVLAPFLTFIDGRSFLGIYFLLLVLSIAGVLIGRKSIAELDQFNYLALTLMVALAGGRIAWALVLGKTNLAYLVVSVVACGLFFGLTTTQGESKRHEFFRDSSGGLSWIKFLLAALFILVAIGGIVFVHAAFMFILFVGGIIVVGMLSDNRKGRRSGFWSCSSCGSNCGSSCSSCSSCGGGCGGGCGGCGD